MENNMTFESWYKSITESVKENAEMAQTAPAPANPTTTTQSTTVKSEISAEKSDIIKDVDSIMSQLATLSVQVKEAMNSLDEFESKELNEEELNEDQAIFELTAGEAGSKMADWIFYAPKYRGMQKKINKMKMNALDIQLAIDLLGGKAEDAPKRDALKAKKSNMDAAIKDLQSEVDTKARERGEYIGKVLSSEKIKGKMELVKRASGQEDNPTKKKELADSFKELNRRFAEEQSAIKELQNKEKEKEAAKKAEEPKREEPKKEEPTKEEPKKDANTELEADIKSYNKNIADERASVEKAKEELKSETDPEKVAKLKDSIQKSKEDIAELQNSVKDLKAELKKNASPKESLMFSATELGLNELASEISTKENWQLENNSALYAKYKMMIDRQSSSNKINESNAISIADKFRTLLG
jgi:uncharacterized protein YlxW (UPF0749 family)